MSEKYITEHTKVFIDGKWKPATYFEMYYPLWIRIIPIKSLRRRLEKWYWKHGGEEAKS